MKKKARAILVLHYLIGTIFTIVLIHMILFIWTGCKSIGNPDSRYGPWSYEGLISVHVKNSGEQYFKPNDIVGATKNSTESKIAILLYTEQTETIVKIPLKSFLTDNPLYFWCTFLVSIIKYILILLSVYSLYCFAADIKEGVPQKESESKRLLRAGFYFMILFLLEFISVKVFGIITPNGIQVQNYQLELFSTNSFSYFLLMTITFSFYFLYRMFFLSIRNK